MEFQKENFGPMEFTEDERREIVFNQKEYPNLFSLIQRRKEYKKVNI